ncbi:substrate-binding domain-containing protein [Microbacteriaceae bacterium K1510]|nr:substrate-binding domain-containing protein [Microbacteriaceae bacterium K1510]
MSAGAVEAVVRQLAPEFERASGHKVDLNFGTAGSMRDRIKNGEKADLVILADAGIGELDKLGHFAHGSVTPLGRSVTGMIVRDGTPAPDISTPAAFVQALRDASSFTYTDPKSGGTGGIMFAGLLQKLGLLDEVNAKTVFGKGGHDVSVIIAEGRAALGTTFVSEALPVKGVTVIGPLPGELYYANTYTAALAADSAVSREAAALLSALTDPATRPRWTAAGLEPAFP